MNVLALIPARMGSSRFPGKPLKTICGKPMIGHVYQNVVASQSLTFTAVATCDQEIFDYIESIGGTAVMTSNQHERASDRCAEALLKLETEMKIKFDIIVMVQGDEPMTNATMIDEAVSAINEGQNVQVVNLVAPILSEDEFYSPNTIKVICDIKGNALAFSRQPIPNNADSQSGLRKKQVCVIPFRRDYLIKYNQMSPTPLEIAESVDMMRVLEHGETVKMANTSYETYAVDTPEDLIKVEQIMQKEGLCQ